MNQENGPIEELKEEMLMTIKNWWVFLILGILAIVVGIWMLTRPGITFTALSIFFSVSFLVTGLSSCYMAIANRKNVPAWGWGLVSGIIVLILGVLLIISPGMAEGTMIYYVAFALMFGGFHTINLSFILKKSSVPTWWVSLVLGILTIILSILLMMHPVMAVITIVMWSALGLIAMGISFCSIGYRLSKTKGQIKRHDL